MADFITSCKNALIKSAKFVSRNAKRLTNETKFKTHEHSDLQKRKALIRDLGELMYKLSCDGLELPEDALALTKEIALLDSDLSSLRSDHAAQKAADAQERAAEKAAHAAEKAAAKAAAAIAKSTAPVEVKIPETELPEPIAAPEQAEAPVLDVAVEAETEEKSEVPTLQL